MSMPLLKSTAEILQRAYRTLICASYFSALLCGSILPTYALEAVSPSGTHVVDSNDETGRVKRRVSPSGTSIPAEWRIVDGDKAIWKVKRGVVYKNGEKAGYSANVTTLLWHNGAIYQQNRAGNWRVWQDGWKSVAHDPRGSSVVVKPNPQSRLAAGLYKFIDSGGKVTYSDSASGSSGASAPSNTSVLGMPKSENKPPVIGGASPTAPAPVASPAPAPTPAPAASPAPARRRRQVR